MILLTGAGGQIGVDLVRALRQRHGAGTIVSTDLRESQKQSLDGVEYASLDVTSRDQLNALIERIEPDMIFHLAGILSARGQKQPRLCWDVNVGGIRNILEAARRTGARIFWPSSIAVFGPNTPRENTPQYTVTDPTTMYGTSKVAGELLSQYYAAEFEVDVRSLRFPGVVSHAAPPGGGTTDWAVEMLEYAVRGERYTCFVSEDTRMPMMYMPDAVNAALQLMDADPEDISVRTSYNIAAVSFTPSEMAAAIREHQPDFECSYEPDFRQDIAESWPMTIDDSSARTDWGWSPEFGLREMVGKMLRAVAKREDMPDPVKDLPESTA